MKIWSRLTIAVIMLVFAAHCLASQPVPEPAGLKLISSFEGGKLYRSGKINVLVLHGSYRQMGRQYGRLLSGDLKSLYKNAILDYFQQGRGLSDDKMNKAAVSLYRLYPQRFKDIIEGMAETSGLSLKEQIMLNAIEHYGSMSGCSGIIAWGEYTGKQPLIAGRNYDWFEKYVEFAQSLTVTVFNPDSGIPNAIVTFAGVIYATTGLNGEGIFLELNNGLPSGGSLKYSDRVPAIVSLLAFLNDGSSLDQLDAFFNTTRTDFAFIINAADTVRGVSYEWAPFEHRRRNGDEEGLLVATNHFTDPSWGIVLQDHAGFETVRRWKNLLSLGHEKKGKIDLGVMKEILDTPMNKGGATWPVDGSMPKPYRTTYQIIAVPASLQLWLKVPGFQDWTAVELKGLFRKQ
ncbi:MAG: C45 family autoproteolytic acyltransferase/hydrolase [Syntrophorhabdaceae bacterium]|nr:C45 family autoproteolytic acyltransferase/hydrolase [Syntrophorhabdaceae bacterium]